MKAKLFAKAMEALDNYQASINMYYPDEYINHFRKQYHTLIAEIEKHGWKDDFLDFIMVY